MLSSAKLVRVVDAECLIILCKCYPIFAQNILNYPGDGIGFQSPANLKHPINETNTTRNHYHKSGNNIRVFINLRVLTEVRWKKIVKCQNLYLLIFH